MTRVLKAVAVVVPIAAIALFSISSSLRRVVPIDAYLAIIGAFWLVLLGLRIWVGSSDQQESDNRRLHGSDEAAASWPAGQAIITSFAPSPVRYGRRRMFEFDLKVVGGPQEVDVRHVQVVPRPIEALLAVGCAVVTKVDPTSSRRVLIDWTSTFPEHAR